jgi:hypothetical protein
MERQRCPHGDESNVYMQTSHGATSGRSSAACGIEPSESVMGNSRVPACKGSPSFEVSRYEGPAKKWSQRLAGIGLAGLVGKTVESQVE